MQIAIFSDTHVPEQAAGIPDEFRDLIGGAEVVDGTVTVTLHETA